MFSQSHTALVLGYLKTIAGDDVKKLQGREVVNPEDGDDTEEFYRGRFQQEDRERYWRMMHEYIGSDVTSLVKLPILIFEPMTMLQKMAELMEYAYLLDQADQCEDPYLKMVFAACWAVSVYSAYQRTWKPFNPILGETFEMVNHNGITFLAEQVSQHPPVSAAHAENDHFTYDVTSKLKTKFFGNSLDVYPVGRTRVVLKSTGDVLELIPPPTKVHNVIFGRTWVDSTGNMILKNLTTGDDVVLYFHPCGWCGNDRYKVDGYVYNKDDEAKMLVVGEWNSFLGCQPCDVEGIPLLGTELQEIWTVADVPENDEFQFTYFAHKINSFETAPNNLLSSDSRLRLDRYALETGYIANAGFEKSRLEEKQLAEEREREARQDRFSPRWFNMSGEVTTMPWDDLEIYEYTGKYHQERAVNRVSELSNVSILKFNPWQYDVESMSMAPTTPWDDLKI